MNIETDQVTMNVSAPDLPNTAARKNSGDDASLMDRMQGSTSLLSNTGNDSPNNNSVNDDGDISDKLAPKKRPFQGDGDDDSAVKKLHSPSLADVADGKIDVTKKSQAGKKKWVSTNQGNVYTKIDSIHTCSCLCLPPFLVSFFLRRFLSEKAKR